MSKFSTLTYDTKFAKFNTLTYDIKLATKLNDITEQFVNVICFIITMPSKLALAE